MKANEGPSWQPGLLLKPFTPGCGRQKALDDWVIEKTKTSRRQAVNRWTVISRQKAGGSQSVNWAGWQGGWAGQTS